MYLCSAGQALVSSSHGIERCCGAVRRHLSPCCEATAQGTMVTLNIAAGKSAHCVQQDGHIRKQQVSVLSLQHRARTSEQASHMAGTSMHRADTAL